MILPILRRKLLLNALKKIVHDHLDMRVEEFTDTNAFLASLHVNQPEYLRVLHERGLATTEAELDDTIYRGLIQKLRFDLVSDRRQYDTQAIIDGLAYHIRQLPEGPQGATFEDWKQAVTAMLPMLAVALPEAISLRLPVSDDVLAQVYQELFEKMPFSRSYIFRHYEHRHEDKEYLVFPVLTRKPKRILIIFSGNVGRKTYNRYSWYWNETQEWQGDTVYLFLNDIESHWYVGRVGSHDRTVYRDIIMQVMKNYDLPASAAITIGSSMGGYAAILYAIDLNLGAAISVHPQLCFRSALRYKEGSWETSLRECGENFRDLSDEVFRHNHRPVIYLENGDYEADQVGFDDLLSALRRRESLLILRKTNNASHLTENPSRQQIDALVIFIESISRD